MAQALAVVLAFNLWNIGCPVLALFARAGSDAAGTTVVRPVMLTFPLVDGKKTLLLLNELLALNKTKTTLV